MINYHDDFNYHSIKEMKKRNIMLRLMLLKFAIMFVAGGLITYVSFLFFMQVTAETFNVLSVVFLVTTLFGLSVAAKGLSDFCNFFEKH